MITFISIAGDIICTLEDFEKYKYFYHVKAYVLIENKYCYCNITLGEDIIKDTCMTKDYDNKELTIVYTNIYNYGLLKWIDINKICWDFLSENPNAIYLLEQNLGKIDWFYLSKNPNSIHLL